MTEHSNLNLYTDLDASEMGAITGGINSIFLDRWAARTIAGTPNIARIVQRVINDSQKGALNSSLIGNWIATTSTANIGAWRSLAPIALNYLNSGAAAGIAPTTLATAQNFLKNII